MKDGIFQVVISSLVQGRFTRASVQEQWVWVCVGFSLNPRVFLNVDWPSGLVVHIPYGVPAFFGNWSCVMVGGLSIVVHGWVGS